MATKSTTRKTAAKKAAKTAPAKEAAPKKAGAARATKPVAKKASAPKKAAAKKAPAPKKTVAKKGAGTAPVRKATATAHKTEAPKPRTVRAKSVEKRYRHLGDLLVRKQAELMQAYANAKTDTRDRLDDGTEDYIDYAVNSYAKDFMLSLTELERQQLQLVREAIYRLNRGEYGECLQCGVEIPIKRLEVAPWVRYCIQCQELEDQGLLPEVAIPSFEDESGDDDFADLEEIDEEVSEEEEEEEAEEAEETPAASEDDDTPDVDLDLDDSEE